MLLFSLVDGEKTCSLGKKHTVVSGFLMVFAIKTKTMENEEYKPGAYEDYLCEEIEECAIKVHQHLGPAMLAEIYEVCLCHELSKKGIAVRRQARLPIHYDGLVFHEGLVIDVLVDDLIVVEIEAKKDMHPIDEVQALSKMKLLGLQAGFLINFHVILIKEGIRRFSSA